MLMYVWASDKYKFVSYGFKLRGIAVLVDYHIHTSMSGDAKGKPTEYVETARSKQLVEIGVSDHYHPEEPEYSMGYEKLAEYIETIRSLKKKTDLPLKLGIEIDFIPGSESKIQKVVKLNSFDYVIGSVHFINNWGFDDPKNISEYQKWNITELYETYFGLVQQCARSRLFDIIGHLDLVKKFGYKPRTHVSEVFVNTVEVLRESKVCVEVNTSGLRAPCREIYPSKAFLGMCFDNGIPLTLGSDAHTPDDVGKNFSEALELIGEVGYERIARFTQRKLELVEI